MLGRRAQPGANIARPGPPAKKFIFALTQTGSYALFGLSDGVTVTQRPLEALFMVRIHVGQPFVICELGIAIDDGGFPPRSANRDPPIVKCQTLSPGQ